MWLLLLVALAEARSTGIYLSVDVAKGCDFDDAGYKAQWGCNSSKWNFTTTIPFVRQYCLDANLNNNKFMWWTGGPRATTQFTMRTGDGSAAFDATTYVPGRFVAVYIRALEFDVTYKGLLLYAKNSTGSKVGDWIVPLETNPQFAAAPNSGIMCNRSVMHINAEEKPYVAKFIFVAPPAGTGPITFKCMLKTGPPNPTDYGSFERLPDLTLEEAAAPTDPKKWVVLPQGQSCADYCIALNNGTEPCNNAALSSSMEGLRPNPLDSIYPCHGAVFHDCTGNPRVALPEGFCTYHPANCPTGALCSAVATAAVPLFCVCGTPVTGISASPRNGPGLAAVLVALFVGMWGSRTHMGLAALLLMASALPSAQAHNWLEGTRGRAAKLGANQFCSPNFPQVNRNAIHLQVGAGQNFVVEWAAAHGDSTYYILISDDARANASKLTRATMDSYLAACPGGGFANSTATTADRLRLKYHRFRPDFNLASTNLVNMQVPSSPTYNNTFEPNMISSGPVWVAFSINGSRPLSFYFPSSSLGLRYSSTSPCSNCVNLTNYTGPDATLAQYKPAHMLNDRSCSYVNATNPWIIAIYRFSHQEVSTTFATALLQFPAGTKPGRYQVHYKWSSYCDVMDVDVQPNSVTLPYGTNNPGSSNYDVAQHCWFDKPRIVGDCYEVVTTPRQCQAICTANPSCQGFQLLPLQMDKTLGDSLGLFPEKSYIPWAFQGIYSVGNNTFCDKSKFTNAKAGSYVCYPVTQFQDDFTSSRPLWSLTEDPNHQGFYGTCYIKSRNVTFLPLAANVTDDNMTDFRFGSKCIPCDNIGQDLTNPRWGPQLNFCTDCTKQSVPARKGPTVPTWTWRANGTFVSPVKWLSPLGTPYAFADECALLASRDPSCSKFVMFSDYRTMRLSSQPTTTNINATFKLMVTTPNQYYWHFSNNSMLSYYRSCGCYQGNTTTLPAIDANSTANACDGILPKDCAIRNFSIYELA